MATITFYGQNGTVDLGGSGLGFYGSAFGNSIAVSEYNDTTYITNTAGNAQGPALSNIKYLSSDSGLVDGTKTLNVLDISNSYGLNIRFEHSSAVQVQNAQIFCYYDSVGTDVSGCVVKMLELAHPSPSESGLLGSGSTVFEEISGTGSILELHDSPATSGLHIGDSGGNSTFADTRHDYYVAISMSPSIIGSRTGNRMGISLEYL